MDESSKLLLLASIPTCAALAGIWIGIRRIDNVRGEIMLNVLRAETAKLAVQLRSEMELMRRDMNAGFERIENAMKMHVLEHHRRDQP